jgi:hypothetical protein
MTVTTADQPTTITELSRQDRCDRCGAAAKVRARVRILMVAMSPVE